MDVARRCVIIFTFAFVVVVSFIEVIFRYFPFLKSLGWIEEITPSLNLWAVFLAASIGITRNSHISVDCFLKRFPQFLQGKIRAITRVSILAFFVIFIIFGSIMTVQNIPQKMTSLPISIAWFYLSIPVSFFVMFLDSLLILIYGRHPFVKGQKEEQL